MRLFLRQREPTIRHSEWSAAPAHAPEGERVYAIGDIHGRLDLLRMLITAIEEEQRLLPPARPTLVFVGDYVDRGPDSFGVIDWLCQRPLPDFERVHLRGNHEQWFEDFLGGDIAVGPSWLYCGGVQTLASYGVRAALGEDDPMRLRVLQADLAAALPAAHRAFLRGLEPCREIGGYLFVHAGIRPGVPLAEQSTDDFYWIRDAFLHSSSDHGRVVVHGHTIANEAQVCPNRIGIDTGAFTTNVLTCLVLEADRYRLIQTA
ncbi:MAG: metallophosphoesterase family protein [Rhodospirillales bacterium]|nr:metallophosphoesterase family protein [Rhodospirillales bacterium]